MKNAINSFTAETLRSQRKPFWEITFTFKVFLRVLKRLCGEGFFLIWINMKKILAITGIRSEYDISYSVFDQIRKNSNFIEKEYLITTFLIGLGTLSNLWIFLSVFKLFSPPREDISSLTIFSVFQ